jgi:hypothetical protein
MDRRDFLKALAAIGLIPVIGQELLLTSPQPQSNEIYYTIRRINVYGMNEDAVNRAGRARVLRGNTIMLDFAVNTFGGYLYWHAPPGGEIISMNDVRFEVDEGISANTVLMPVDTDYSPYCYSVEKRRGGEAVSTFIPLHLERTRQNEQRNNDGIVHRRQPAPGGEGYLPKSDR